MYGAQKDQYMGSILTPDPTPAYGASPGSENYDEELPLMEGKLLEGDYICNFYKNVQYMCNCWLNFYIIKLIQMFSVSFMCSLTCSFLFIHFKVQLHKS